MYTQIRIFKFNLSFQVSFALKSYCYLMYKGLTKKVPVKHKKQHRLILIVFAENLSHLTAH
jgi:hypothetical protein